MCAWSSAAFASSCNLKSKVGVRRKRGGRSLVVGSVIDFVNLHGTLVEGFGLRVLAFLLIYARKRHQRMGQVGARFSEEFLLEFKRVLDDRLQFVEAALIPVKIH